MSRARTPDRADLYRGHRFPAEMIAHAVRLYLRFALSYRDVEELLAERGVTVSYETVRHRVAKSIVNSPLVETMVYGADTNVGRLLMGVGKCVDCTIRPEGTDARINGHQVVRGGASTTR